MKEYISLIDENIIQSMQEFFEDDEKMLEGVAKCKNILIEYLNKLETTSNENYMEVVEWVVVSFNHLNEEYDYSLIETMERENICEFIFETLSKLGIEIEEDITEEWREW